MDSQLACRIPRLPRGVKLRFDETRQRWFLLGPERVFEPDEIAMEILQRIDGKASLSEIADGLAEAFQAPRDEIANDVAEFVGNLTRIRMLDLAEPKP